MAELDPVIRGGTVPMYVKRAKRLTYPRVVAVSPAFDLYPRRAAMDRQVKAGDGLRWRLVLSVNPLTP